MRGLEHNSTGKEKPQLWGKLETNFFQRKEEEKGKVGTGWQTSQEVDMWAVGRELIILIVEDEAVSRESRMLEEVTRDSEDKRPGEEDRESGRRAHNFYLPNGSKVLVGSYIHLRRDMFNILIKVFIFKKFQGT